MMEQKQTTPTYEFDYIQLYFTSMDLSGSDSWEPGSKDYKGFSQLVCKRNANPELWKKLEQVICEMLNVRVKKMMIPNKKKIADLMGVIIGINEASVKIEIPGIPVSMIILLEEINIPKETKKIEIGDKIKIESYYEIYEYSGFYEYIPYIKKIFIYTLEKINHVPQSDLHKEDNQSV